MKVTVKLLKQLVDFSFSTSELCEKLTMLGLEVETVRTTADMFKDMVTAKITAIKPHPGSEQLKLCRLDTGTETCSVVCGAPNVETDAIVALAHPGSTLPGGGKVEKATIREIDSEGMLVSEKDLGLALESSGIMILDRSLKPGIPLGKALDLEDDIIEFEITPNRSDCLSLIGIAREIAALTHTQIRPPACEVSESGESIHEVCQVTVKDGDLCYRYCARLVRNLTIGPSPEWLKAALFKLGARPINNVVDITNYILLEMGQPLHAFDYDILAGHEIIVRQATPGESITTLDSQIRELPEKALLICDAERPVAVAGIMGGENTFITESTRNVLLEAAHFDPVSVRVTARGLGLSTESSYRFERGVDNANVPTALARAARLMAEVAGGTVAPGTIDIIAKPVEKTIINLRPRTVSRALGIRLTADKIAEHLRALELEVDVNENQESSDDQVLIVRVPTHRNDLEREIDLVEEVARIYGYDNIEPRLPTFTSSLAQENQQHQAVDRVREILKGLGFHETVTYSFINPERLAGIGYPEHDPRTIPVKLKNPLSEEMSVLRTTLFPGMAETVARNVNKQNKNVAIFEMGHVFFRTEKTESLPKERLNLGLALTGSALTPCWNIPAAQADFFHLKGVLVNLADSLGMAGITFKKNIIKPYHPGRGATICLNSTTVGAMGEIHPDTAKRFDLPGRTYFLEIDLIECLSQVQAGFKALTPPRYPKVFRDLALVVPDEVENRNLADQIIFSAGELLENLQLFDVYKGDQLDRGLKSLGFSLELRKEGGTLTEEEVEEVINRILTAAGEKFEARLRL